jgi:hypothetical protein
LLSNKPYPEAYALARIKPISHRKGFWAPPPGSILHRRRNRDVLFCLAISHTLKHTLLPVSNR